MVATRRPALLACAAAACLILVVVAPGAAADTQQFQIFPALRNAFFSSYVAARSSPAPKAQAGSTAAASAGGEKGCVKVETRDLTKAEGQSTFLKFFGNEPHHVGVSGDVLAAGGLFSFKSGEIFTGGAKKAAATPDIYLFNISKANAASPKYIDSVFGKKGAVTDSFLPFGTENGQPKFLASFMGDRKGLSPGKLAEVAYVNERDKWEVVAEHEGGVDGAADPSFTPHGFDRNGPNGSLIVTADYVTADTVFAPSKAFKWGTTVRVWNLTTKQVIARWDLATLPGIKETPQGLMSVRWTGGCGSDLGCKVLRTTGGCGSYLGWKNDTFWFSSGTGHLYLIDASKRAADGIESAIKEVYTLAPEPVYGSCVFSGRFANNTRLLVTSLALNEVRLVDTTDPTSIKTIQIYELPKGASGTPQPHVVVIDANATLAAVTTYYVEQPTGKGLWTKQASKELLLFSIAADKNSFAPIKTVNFNDAFEKATCGISAARGRFARPHGAVFVSK
ncbi:hypothetical protein MNEG_4259 [Monoraphidium neglectum]|uniref:Methanethiol oxidase n=1 Tax=Monoraphidium neglectum TaxID=145388 RepID=A0A0D2NEW6_9CHLO|nr:hypothetical protein MNEG_4259 [Monoraphidium neglectum]KIZ03696.1 hypothetical protein MNEG_4259 [Monoraphidium neglectum]|eukprot:XP_013902715.1 hypothetical protein MNEG_4259 [Monoraphidium neglectum]